MHVQLTGESPGRVIFRHFERRMIGGFTPWIVTDASAAALPCDVAKLRREAVRRADRQRETLRRAFSWEG